MITSLEARQEFRYLSPSPVSVCVAHVQYLVTDHVVCSRVRFKSETGYNPTHLMRASFSLSFCFSSWMYAREFFAEGSPSALEFSKIQGVKQ